MSTHVSGLHISSDHQIVYTPTPEEDKNMCTFLQFIVGVYALAQQLLDSPSPSEIPRLIELAKLTVHPDYLDSYNSVLYSAYKVCCEERRLKFLPSSTSRNGNPGTQATHALSEAHMEAKPSRVPTSISTEKDSATESNGQDLTHWPSRSKATPQREFGMPQCRPSGKAIVDRTKKGKAQRAGKRLPAQTVQQAPLSAPANPRPSTSYGTSVRPHNSSNRSIPVTVSPSAVRHNPNHSRPAPPFIRAIPRHNRQPSAQGVHASQPISNNARKRPADSSWESGRSKRSNTAAGTIPPRVACCWAAQIDSTGQHTVCCDALIFSDKESVLLHLENAHGVKRGRSHRVMTPCLWGAQCPSRDRVTQRDLAAHIEEVHLKSDGNGIVCENVGCARSAIYVGNGTTVARRLCGMCSAQLKSRGLVISRRPRLVEAEREIPGNSYVPFDIL